MDTKAIDKARDAVLTERQLTKQRESVNPETINVDLTYAVNLHAAHLFERSEQYTEALNAYSTIIKNKAFDKAGASFGGGAKAPRSTHAP